MMKKKQLSKAQLWARQRNSAKFRLCGITANLKGILESKVLTASEVWDIEISIDQILDVLHGWKDYNAESKSNFTGEKS